ncbi:hypothetical protein HYX11_01635 [Candidatus Woesearchaeota archaeon]|nr:hypothetical protein [Candidatus Woesearchaeota archaeon]
MMKLKMNKKAITPLMIGFMLVSFAVAVASGVMNFAKAQVEDEASCAIDINMKWAVIGGQDEICFNQATQEVKFTLENGVNIKVEGLVVNIIGTKSSESKELNGAKIIKAGNYFGTVGYNYNTVGNIRQIKFIPKVIFSEIEEVCAEKALVVENIRNC